MDEKDFIEEEGTVSEEDEKIKFADDCKILTQSGDPQIRSLCEKIEKGRMDVQPGFQRRFVWDDKKCSRLIESVIIGVPLPAIYLSEESDGTVSVIDGQQRLTAFSKFMRNEFRLTGLEFRGDCNDHKYKDLDKHTQEKIGEGVLRQITFLKDSNADLKFEIFKRLNSGAVSLNDQEMRNCMYRGRYNDLLCKLADDSDFRKVMGFGKQPHPRMKDVEYALRFSAFHFHTYLRYASPMKKFMDKEMEARQKIDEKDAEKLTSAFKNAVACVLTVLGNNAFRRWKMDKDTHRVQREPNQFSASLFDVLMWSFSQRDRGEITRNADSIKEALIHLMTTNGKFEDSITLGTSNKKTVKTRFKIWDDELDEILRDEEKQPRCFSRALKQELFDKDPVCGICRNQISDIDDAAVDHIEQYWRGGKTIPENARLAHRHCNATRSKND